MAAKEVKFGDSARQGMLEGVNYSGQCRKSNPGAQRPQCSTRQVIWCSNSHQRRCICSQRDRAERQVRKHGCTDG